MLLISRGGVISAGCGVHAHARARVGVYIRRQPSGGFRDVVMRLHETSEGGERGFLVSVFLGLRCLLYRYRIIFSSPSRAGRCGLRWYLGVWSLSGVLWSLFSSARWLLVVWVTRGLAGSLGLLGQSPVNIAPEIPSLLPWAHLQSALIFHDNWMPQSRSGGLMVCNRKDAAAASQRMSFKLKSLAAVATGEEQRQRWSSSLNR